MSPTPAPIKTSQSLEIYSMTGFGQAQVNSKLCRLNLQLKSVNSRFLDLTLKIPDELAAFEGKLREAITHAVKRGKVEVRLNWQTLLPSDGEAQTALINTHALAQILAVQNAILAHAPDAAPMTVSALMNAPAVLPSSVGASEVLSAVTADEINELIHTAITQFKQSRQQEGMHLAQAISERLDAIGAVVHNLRGQLPELLKHQEAKLTERLLKALDSDKSETKHEVKLATSAIPREELIERIRQEASLTAIRIDVAEELDRLEGHLANARQCFADGGNIGKKLDFLMQEFNREANTLGSKSASLLQTQASLDLKLMIEQMREQVQNLE